VIDCGICADGEVVEELVVRVEGVRKAAEEGSEEEEEYLVVVVEVEVVVVVVDVIMVSTAVSILVGWDIVGRMVGCSGPGKKS